MRNAGVVPKDYKDQLNVFMKANYNPSKQLKFQFTTSYKESQARGFGNSMSTIYGWAINRDMSDYKTITGYPNWANRYDNWDALYRPRTYRCHCFSLLWTLHGQVKD
jgi:hypothetical protein